MKSFKIDSKGDLVIENGSFVMIDGVEEMLQCVWLVLSTNVNEWYLNMNHGLDYMAIVGKGRRKEEVIAALEDAIYQVDRVKQVFIKDIDISADRHLTVQGYITNQDNEKVDLKALEVIKVG